MWQAIVVGGGALIAGSVATLAVIEALDRHHRRRARRFGRPEEYWRAYFTEPRGPIDRRMGQAVVRRTGVMAFCKTCFAPFAGPLARSLRAVGHGPVGPRSGPVPALPCTRSRRWRRGRDHRPVR